MTHDITHCQGQLGTFVEKMCPKRENCYRYVMYLDAVKKNLQYISITLPTEVPCRLLWENKELIEDIKKELNNT